MEINFIAILLCAIASMVIGSIWYGPLFGKPFMKAMGMDKWSKEKKAAEQKKMGMMYFVQFLASLLMFYILACFMNKTGDINVNTGLMIASGAWLGFIMPTQLGSSIWGGKMVLFWIGAGCSLVTTLSAGAIIGFFG